MSAKINLERYRNVGVWRVANRSDFLVLSEDVWVGLIIEIRSFRESHYQGLFNASNDVIVSQLDAPKVSRVQVEEYFGYPDVPDVNRMQADLDVKIDPSLILSHSSCFVPNQRNPRFGVVNIVVTLFRVQDVDFR
jgi:hypothetical protein